LRSEKPARTALKAIAKEGSPPLTGQKQRRRQIDAVGTLASAQLDKMADVIRLSSGEAAVAKRKHGGKRGRPGGAGRQQRHLREGRREMKKPTPGTHKGWVVTSGEVFPAAVLQFPSRRQIGHFSRLYYCQICQGAGPPLRGDRTVQSKASNDERLIPRTSRADPVCARGFTCRVVVAIARELW